MKTRRPIEAKSTSRLLEAVFPREFKLVKDKKSNGYKFTNLLYGVEIDEADDRTREVYANSYLGTYDFSSDVVFSEVRVSGNVETSISGNGGSIEIKVTDEDQFYNGAPTRRVYNSLTDVPSGMPKSGIVGLEYFRSNDRGSGYFLMNLDIDQGSGYIAGLSGTLYRYGIDRIGTIDNTYSGDFPGLFNQNFDTNDFDEIINPIDPRVLRSKYPETRRVLDDCVVYAYIPHY